MILSSLSNWCTSVIIASSVVLLTSSVLDLTLVYLRLSNVSIAFCYCTFHHYLFSFNMDGFNPFQLKQSGRSATVMGLYMVCLNIPPEERCKPENMYLAGIIPGPSEPSMEAINHFLAPLVDDLLESFVNGVHYTRTWKYPSGRQTRSTLALIICDLPTSCQALGFTGPQSANFCSYCKLQLSDINNLGYGSWVRRTCDEHRRLALQWHNASSEAQCYEHRPLGKRFKRHVTVGITPDRFKRVTSHLTSDRNTLTNTRYSGTPKSCNHNDTTGKWCHSTLFSHWIISRS